MYDRPIEPIKVVAKAVDQALAVNAVSRMIKDTAKSLTPDKPKVGALGLSFDDACKNARAQAASQTRTAPAPVKSMDLGISR